MKPETALPSVQEGEQLSNGETLDGASGKPEEGKAVSFTPSEKREPGKTEKIEEKEDRKEKREEREKEKPLEKGENPAANALKNLTGRVASLQTRLDEAGLVEQELRKKISSMEAELSDVKNAAMERERALLATVESAREQARSEGKAEGKAQGYEEGLKSGHAAGLSKADAETRERYREKFSGLVTALEGISAKLEENFSGLVSLNQPRMLRLWQEMLKKMLRREMEFTPDAVLDVLSDVLPRVSDKNHILIYVSPWDLELLEASLHEEFEDVLRGVKHLELKPDTSVDKGSCIVETNLGVYDARWRTQLDQIEMSVEKLLQQLGKSAKANPLSPPDKTKNKTGAAPGQPVSETGAAPGEAQNAAIANAAIVNAAMANAMAGNAAAVNTVGNA
jgi:flagellar assembly protein FliH